MQFRCFLLAILMSSAVSLLYAAEAEPCEIHDWFSRVTVEASPTSLLCKGAMDASLDRRKAAIAKLNRVIIADPKSAQAYRAHEFLLSLYFRAGQYREALTEADAMLAIKPTAEDVIDDHPLLLALSELPDQSGRAKHSQLIESSIDDGNPHLPVMANKRPAISFMDTGANISLMSDTEAQALGLTMRPVDTQVADIGGSKTPVKVSVVDDLVIGMTHLKHVAFLVLPHDQPPFDEIPVKQQMLLGIQVLRALRTLRIDKAGQVEVGPKIKAGASYSPIAFDEAIPVIQMSVEGKTVTFTFDTGATRTTLNPPFSSAFPQLIEKGTRKDHKLTGVGGSTHQQSVEIPRMQFILAGKPVVLAPATVLLQKTTGTSTWAAGNLGYDLIRQTAPFVIDFKHMRFYSGS